MDLDDPVNLYELHVCDVAAASLDATLGHLSEGMSPSRGGPRSLFERFGVAAPLGAWVTATGVEGRVAMLLHWPSLDGRDATFARLLASGEWQGQDASGGPGMGASESWLLGPRQPWRGVGAAAGSARPAGEVAQAYPLHELCIHRLAGGQSVAGAAYLAEVEHPQVAVLGGAVLGVFDLLFGPDMPAMLSFIAWPDFDTRNRAVARLHVEPRVLQHRQAWKQAHGEPLLRATERTLLRPVGGAAHATALPGAPR